MLRVDRTKAHLRCVGYENTAEECRPYVLVQEHMRKRPPDAW